MAFELSFLLQRFGLFNVIMEYILVFTGHSSHNFIFTYYCVLVGRVAKLSLNRKIYFTSGFDKTSQQCKFTYKFINQKVSLTFHANTDQTVQSIGRLCCSLVYKPFCSWKTKQPPFLDFLIYFYVRKFHRG